LFPIADDNELIFCGDGIGNIIVPNEKYGNLTMPKKIENLVLALISDPYLLTDYIIGYYATPHCENHIGR